jgi:hypothetical protein
MIDILGIQISEGEIKDNKCMATAEKYLVNNISAGTINIKKYL